MAAETRTSEYEISLSQAVTETCSYEFRFSNLIFCVCDATLSQITRYSLHSVCLSVCPFVTFAILVTFQTYRQTSPPCTNSPVSVLSHQTLQRNSDGITVQGNIEYGWDIRKSRFIKAVCKNDGPNS